MLEALNEAKPEEFDKLYVEQQIKAHNKAADLFDEYAERRRQRRVEAIRGQHAAGDQAASRRGEEAQAIAIRLLPSVGADVP